MTRVITPVLLIFFLSDSLFTQNSAPVIQHFSASINWNSKVLLLQYDVTDADNDLLEVSVALSGDSGKTYSLTGQVPVSGDVGFPVPPGNGHTISCDVSALNSGGATFTVRLVADDKQPFNLQQLVNAVDSNRLRADLTFVEGIRHRATGLAHLNAVRDSLEHCFGGLELYTQLHTFSYGNYTGRNVLGSFAGTVAPDSVVVVDAHYDTVSNAPGADDNGSGTVGVMEIARLLSRYPAKKTLRYVGFDLEEAGLVGSARYVSTGLPVSETVAGVFNFEMIGYYSDEPNSQETPAGFNLLFPAAYNQLVADSFRGNFITNVGNTAYPDLADLFSSSAATYVPGLKVIKIVMPTSLPVPDLMRSDHASFWAVNRPALMLTDGADFRNKSYHTSNDTLNEKLDFTFMSNVVKATLAAAAQLAGLLHGDWATTNFDGTVNTIDPLASCSVSVSRKDYRRLDLIFSGCPLHPLDVELFDARGALIHREAVQIPPQGGSCEIACPELSAGIYFVKISSPESRRTVKVALP